MEKVKESAARGQLRQITDDLVKAYDNGSLKGKETLINFMSDVARNLVVKKNAARRFPSVILVPLDLTRSAASQTLVASNLPVRLLFRPGSDDLAVVGGARETIEHA